MLELQPIRRALISVSDKTGIVQLATALADQQVEILSTGGTAKLLAEHQIPVVEVSDYTSHPEIMSGRVKTLHPKIHAGILGRIGEDDQVMREHAIETIDLVVVNLYPFQQTVSDPSCTLQQALENIDIGGPSMIRAAAKNHQRVTVVVDTASYPQVIAEMASNQGAVTAATRSQLAGSAFAHTAAYDAAIANYFAAMGAVGEGGVAAEKATPDPGESRFPSSIALQFQRKQTLRYGENSHQQAAFYLDQHLPAGCVATAQQLQGKPLSYNNIADADAALECVKEFTAPACVIVKHANPCGVAVGASIADAYQKAFKTDPTSAFGGIIAFNRQLDSETAAAVVKQQFVEVIVVPSVTREALEVLANKTNLRLLKCGDWGSEVAADWDYKRVKGGLLVQDRDCGSAELEQLTTVTARSPTEAERADLLFAWKVAKFVKSNAIVYAKGEMTVAVGAGQMSRVYSAKIAGLKAAEAQLQVAGSVMASDAFFPFRDGIDAAAAVGITAVIQPGGSIRDQAVIEAANEHKIAMLFTGVRHFRH